MPAFDFNGLPPILKGGAFFIDNSTMESVLECDRKALYRIAFKREFNGKANALNFGGAAHVGLDVRYRHGGYAVESLHDQQMQALQYLAENPTDDWRTAELLVDLLSKYANQYPVEEFRVVASTNEQGENTPFVELPFAMPMGTISLAEPMLLPNLRFPIYDNALLPAEAYQQAALSNEGEYEMIWVTEIPIVWTGKIDVVISHAGEYWLMDHKTTSMFGDTYYEQYNLSSQFMGYKWALEQALKVPVAGVLVNVLAIRKPTKTGAGCTFHRKYMRTENHMVPEWHANTLYHLQEFFGNMQNGYMPMRYNSCRTKWHSNCEYLSVCTLPKDSRHMYLGTGDFRTVTWSPLRNE